MTEFTQTLRHYCRNPRCRSKLPSPASDPRKAFCTPGCHSSFYLKRCLVCENDKPAGSTARRKLCRRPKCEGRYRKNSAHYSFLGADTASAANVPRSTQSTGIKSAHNGDRPWRHIAGPELGANTLRCAVVGAVEPARRNARHCRGPGTLIGPSDPPINLLGGYKFPNAPEVELTSPPATSTSAARAGVADSSHTIPADLSVPNFLKVAP